MLYGVLAAPLREKESVPFEKLLGTDHALFRMTAVIAGLLLIAGSAGYLCVHLYRAGGRRGAVVACARDRLLDHGNRQRCVHDRLHQGAGRVLHDVGCGEMRAAAAVLERAAPARQLPHDLHRPAPAAAFAFGLLADVMLVFAFYHIARLLYGRPQPMLLALSGALTAVMSFSDLGGYGLARLMGVTSVAWPGKMRCCAAACRRRPASMCSRSFSC
ncbi:MAG: hypothetical protein ACLR4Z_03905 [Butyricicoccaceae bacterium]